MTGLHICPPRLDLPCISVGRLSRVRVDAEGLHAVTCSDDGSARVWEVESGACVSVLQVEGAEVVSSILRGGELGQWSHCG
jgi:WD40 repeat protein